MELRGSTFTATFGTEQNNFVSLQNRLSDDDYIKFAPQFPLVCLYALIDGEKHELRPGAPETTGDETELAIRYNDFGGRAITATLTIRADDDLLRISASFDNQDESAEITEVLMPHLSGI